MRIILSIVLILGAAVYSNSQTFEKIIKTTADDVVYDAVQINDDHVVFAHSYGTYPGAYNSKLYKINLISGKISDSTDVSGNSSYTFDWLSNILITNNDELTIVGGCKNISSGDKQIYIAQYSENLELIRDTIVGDPEQDESAFDVKLSSDNLLLLAGIRQTGTLLLEERELDGALKRSVNYNNGGLLATCIMEIPSKNKYHLFRYWDNLHSYYIIDKYDLSIDTLLEYPVGFLPAIAAEKINSDSYFVAGRKLSIPGPQQDNLSYIEINFDGEIIKEVEYETDSIVYYWQHCFSLYENRIYFGGTYPCTWVPPLEFYPEQRWILTYRLDLEGNVIWQKFFKGEVNYMPLKILATTDGGAMIFSARYDWNNPIPMQRDVHILKIDSLGNYTPLTSTPEVMEKMQKQILVYPNPAAERVNFVFGLYHDLEIGIYNLTGEMIFSGRFKHQAEVDISGLKPGTYIYRISGEKGFYEEGKIVKQ
ncbi:MAG: T9SS type A sorting domain-containing protein [Bacteroidales bacterium]|nr:T9SS type A sorting domain-containing protein [Bacteroidales bacterium]